MTIPLLILALFAVGYVASGVKAYWRERIEECNYEVWSPTYARVLVKPRTFLIMTLDRPAELRELPSDLFKWERRIGDWLLRPKPRACGRPMAGYRGLM